MANGVPDNGSIVIVGAGECGTRAAFALREAGHQGPVVLIGSEPHLPYERPPLSKKQALEIRRIAAEEAFTEAGITFHRGRTVSTIDRDAKTVRLEGGEEIAYDRLLLATGARARRLPGAETALTLRTVDDAEAILGRLVPGIRLVVIGGGFIGLELAATAREIGAEVAVIEMADRLMARAVPAEIAAVLQARHVAAGVRLLLGAAVDRVEPHRVTLADGTVLDADVIVAGIGAAPDTALAADAGLAIANGIVVDGNLRTSDPSIFAAGDCCAFPYGGRSVRLECWRNAQDQGAHAARAMLGIDEHYARVPWFWSDQYDLGLQISGLPDPAAPFLRRERSDGALLLFQLDADGVLTSVSGVGEGNAVARDIKLGEMLIERGVRPDPAQLVDPSVGLKNLLKSAG